MNNNESVAQKQINLIFKHPWLKKIQFTFELR